MLLKERRKPEDAVSRETRMFGAVEAGGTKFVCAIGDASGRIHAQTRFPTADPASTLAAMRDFLRTGSASFGALAAIGLACFGPVHSGQDVGALRFYRPYSKSRMERYRYRGNVGARIFRADRIRYRCQRRGAGGTSLGCGTRCRQSGIPDGRHGNRRRRGGARRAACTASCIQKSDISTRGVTRWMWISTASARFMATASRDWHRGRRSWHAAVRSCGSLDAAHPQWELEADYLGQLCAQLVFTLSPQRIVMGGGVMSQLQLLPPHPTAHAALVGRLCRPPRNSRDNGSLCGGPCFGRAGRCSRCLESRDRRESSCLVQADMPQHALQGEVSIA